MGVLRYKRLYWNCWMYVERLSNTIEFLLLGMRYPVWKRSIDVFGAVTGLLFVIPFTPVIAFAIVAESKGGVFVKLERISEGRVIRVYKFRSMVHDALDRKRELLHLNERNDGPFFKISHDPRVTRVGRVLRRFRLDEMPQLINVLKGELALVGPRPHEPEEVLKYPDEYRTIIEYRAGATGHSQVNGASSLPFLKELKLDKHYLENMSPAFDAKIIAKTMAILFFDPTAV